jgi:two-component system NtrC family sensor kinase
MITLAFILRFVCPENFALVALPISVSATGPIFVALYFVFKKLKDKKFKISIVDKAFLLTSTIWGLHFLDYPFLRPIVDLKFSFFGFLFAILLTYLLSILIPVVINKRIYLNINDLIMDQLDVRTKELARAQRIISKQERLATMGNLVAGVAHEIKNPLNIIGVSTNYLQRFIHKYPTEDLVEYFKSSNEDKIRQFTRDVSRFVEATETINTSISRADEVVKSMLGHARGDESKELVKTNLNAFIDDNIKLVESSQSLRNSLTIKTDFDIQCPSINIYINDIRRILINLLENSIYAISKKTPLENGFRGVITVRTKLNSDKEEIKISIIDNGVGIPEAIKERIFDPFMTTKPVGEGTGLGLSISQEIVKEHMGRLEVESIEGQGASFHLYISTNL